MGEVDLSENDGKEQAGHDLSQRRGRGPGRSADVRPDVDRRVDDGRSRRHLADDDGLRVLFLRDPAALFDHFPPDERQHRIDAAEGERSDLQKDEEDVR